MKRSVGPMSQSPRKSSLLVSLLGSILIFASLSLAQSQISGTISGTITDKTGGTIPDAKITIMNKATGQSQNATTNNAGYYVVTNLAPGTYDVTAEKGGFERCVETGVQLDPAASVQLACTMQMGQITQTVEVQAQAIAVQTEQAQVSR